MKPKSFIGKSLFLFIPLLLSACGKATTLTPTLIPQVISPPSVTKTPSPAQTQRPSQTPDSHAIWSAAWHTELTATKGAQETVIAQFPVGCQPDGIRNYLVSPDGNWIACGCYGGENVFVVTDRVGSKYRYIPSGNKVGEIPGNGYCEGVPIHWSNDGRYVYYFLYYCIEADFVWDYSLGMPVRPEIIYRMNTMTGTTTAFTHLANYFSFSPTGRHLLYFKRYGLFNYAKDASVSIYITDLQTGDTQGYRLVDTLAAANVVWSSDGRRAYFVAEKGAPWDIFQQSERSHRYTIYMINLDIPSLILIMDFPDMKEMVYPVDIDEGDNLLILHKSKYQRGYMYEELYLSLTTRQLISTTPILTP